MVVVTRRSPKTSSSLSRMRAAAVSRRRTICDGGVEQQFALFGENQSARVAVKKRGIQAFLQRPDLSAHGRLTEMQRLARVRQAARIGHRVKYSELVPIHCDITVPI